MNTKRKFFNRDLLFYVVILAIPVLQFCVFYIGVNGRSFLYSFQEITYIDATHTSIAWNTNSISLAFKTLFTKDYLFAFRNSFIVFIISYLVGTTLALFFSYFIYKKLFGSKLFKVFLFLPSIISAIVLCFMFKQFVSTALPNIFNSIFHPNPDDPNRIVGLLDDPNSARFFWTLVFYHIFVSFGTSVLMYSNAMGSISPEIIEAGKIDGASSFREFFSIVVPSVFPTISTFTITSIAALFVNQLNLFAFWGTNYDGKYSTIGYLLYKATIGAGNKIVDYPKLSAMGLLLTLVAVPLTFGIKYLLERFGPSEK